MNRELFRFALSPKEPDLTPHSDQWREPLPVSRHAFGDPAADRGRNGKLTYGDYFRAARDFLLRDECALLCHACASMLDRKVAPGDLDRISVYLVKYGAFYHPSQVVVNLFSRQLLFVLNVAVSPQGREALSGEFLSLQRLNTELSSSYWPMVYGEGVGLNDDHALPMFLGQWLHGFYEFHLSGSDSARHRVVVWDTDNGHRRLTERQVKSCLAQAACILAYSYNPLTFECIGNWHHAAGDFVAALTGDSVTLRLITVRRFAPLLEGVDPDVELILEAILVFLIQTSLKLRLDRIDGTGPTVMYNNDVVGAVCEGFFKGLRSAATHRGLPPDFHESVRAYTALHGENELESMAAAMVEKMPFNPQERDLLRDNLDGHVIALAAALRG